MCKGGITAYIFDYAKWAASLQEKWQYWEPIGVQNFIPTYEFITDKNIRDKIRQILYPGEQSAQTLSKSLFDKMLTIELSSSTSEERKLRYEDLKLESDLDPTDDDQYYAYDAEDLIGTWEKVDGKERIEIDS